MKIGIIGLGDIAEKAYLPLICRKKAEIHLCTRDEQKLSRFGEQYRIKDLHTTVESLINSGINAAFVHTATASHDSIVNQLLFNNIHVYVDKPMTYNYGSTERLVELARQKNLLLHVGFNRRFAPAYRQATEIRDPNMIIMQKNRKSLPGDIRTFIFDDFIHVIDTLVFLFPYSIDKLIVTGRKKESTLYHVVVQFVAANGAIAIGIMNRDSGTVEEKLEVFGPEEKRVIYNVGDTTIHQDRSETKPGLSDWESTLHKRGFNQIIDNFLQAVESGVSSPATAAGILRTHRICEDVVDRLGG